MLQKLLIFLLAIFPAISYSQTDSISSNKALKEIDKVKKDSVTNKQLDVLVKDTIILLSNRLPNDLLKVKSAKLEASKPVLIDKINKTYKTSFENIDNIGMRYVFRELQAEYSNNDSISNAVNVLLDYVQNDSIRNMVLYLKEYVKNRKTDDALKRIRAEIKKEEFENEQLALSMTKKERKYEIDESTIKLLNDYIEKDSVNLWLREICRDSINIGVKNIIGDSVKMWVNNGKREFKRFWLKKNKTDSIGIWVQNAEQGNIRILIDDDVYQESVNKTKKSLIKEKLEGAFSKNDSKLATLQKYKRHVRYWKFGSKISLNYTQGYVSESYSNGGESSMAFLFGSDSYINYKKGNSVWDNTINIKLGTIKSPDEEFRKNEDKIELNSKYGQRAFKKWYYTAQFNAKTQMFDGYDYPDEGPRELKTKFFGPAYIIGSLGLDYKPNSRTSLFLSPFTSKYTVVSDTARIDQTLYGIDEDKKIKKEVGAFLNFKHKFKFWEDSEIENKLKLYSNYAEEAKNIDIDWEFSWILPLNQYFTTKITTHVISDDDTSSKIQFKENLLFGLTYFFR